MKPVSTTRCALALALCGVCLSATADNVEFSGYMRSATGVSTRGGSQVCFGLPGADTKWRLGNECDYVIEPTFDMKIAEFEGAQWRVRVMPSVYHAWGQTAPANADDLTAHYGQIYTYGNKVSQLFNGTVWGGRRYYNRLQTTINDQFLENNDGDGAGVEDMQFAIGKASVAFMMNPDPDPNNNRFSLPIRLTDIKTLPNGSLSVYYTPSMQTRSRDQVSNTATPKEGDGSAFGLYQTIGGTFGGETLLGLKFDHLGDTYNSRAVVQQGAKIGEKTHLDLVAEYRVNTVGSVGSRWLALGARTDTYIAGPFRFLAELGQDRVRPDGGDEQVMTKITFAGAISAGKDYSSRPTLRLYVTHAEWNEAARQVLNQVWVNGPRLQQVYGDSTSGTTLGIQVETWW